MSYNSERAKITYMFAEIDGRQLPFISDKSVKRGEFVLVPAENGETALGEVVKVTAYPVSKAPDYVLNAPKVLEKLSRSEAKRVRMENRGVTARTYYEAAANVGDNASEKTEEIFSEMVDSFIASVDNDPEPEEDIEEPANITLSEHIPVYSDTYPEQITDTAGKAEITEDVQEPESHDTGIKTPYLPPVIEKIIAENIQSVNMGIAVNGTQTIAHFSDILIGAISDVYLTASQDSRWQDMRLDALSGAFDSAIENGAEIIILTGNLFAENYITDETVSRVLDIIRSKQSTFIKPENDDMKYLRSAENIPENLHIIKGETEIRGIKCLTASGDRHSSILITDNISSGEYNADYVTDGLKIFADGNNIPCPRPENISFDDETESGYMLLAFTDGRFSGYRKINTSLFGFRTVNVSLDIDDEQKSTYRKCAAAVSEIDKNSFVRIILNGSLNINEYINIHDLKNSLKERFFFLEIYNNCGLDIDESDFANDISLKSEFVRMVLGDDSLSISEKNRIIRCGWNALCGKELSE